MRMSAAEIANIIFIDRDSGDNAGAVVRVVDKVVALGFWIEHDGDLDIAMDCEVASRLAAALIEAAARSKEAAVD